MKKVRILIVEDEILTATAIEEILVQEGYEICEIVDSAESALKALKKDRPDFVFLDIKLQGQFDGIWLANEINTNYNIPFAYLTAQGDKETVSSASKTRPYAYLIKPFNNQDIFETIETGILNFSNSIKVDKPSITNKFEKDTIFLQDCIFVKTGKIFVKVNLEEVLYFQSDKNYVDIFLEGKKYTSRNTLKEISTFLTFRNFIQVNRSTIVNLNKIDAISSYSVHVKQHEIILSDNYKDSLMEKIKFLGS